MERPGDRGPRRARSADRHGRLGRSRPPGGGTPRRDPLGATAGCAGRPGTASPAATSACSRTTATSPRACWPCTRRPRRGAGWSWQGTSWTSWPSSSSMTRRTAPAWHDTAADAEALVHRPFDPGDGPTPGRHRRRRGGGRHVRRAGRLTAPPRARCGGGCLAGPAGEPGAPRRRLGGRGRGGAARRTAGGGRERPRRPRSRGARRGRTCVVEPGSRRGGRGARCPRRPVAGRSTAGRRAARRRTSAAGFVCSAPVTDVSALSAAMSSS